MVRKRFYRLFWGLCFTTLVVTIYLFTNRSSPYVIKPYVITAILPLGPHPSNSSEGQISNGTTNTTVSIFTGIVSTPRGATVSGNGKHVEMGLTQITHVVKSTQNVTPTPKTVSANVTIAQLIPKLSSFKPSSTVTLRNVSKTTAFSTPAPAPQTVQGNSTKILCVRFTGRLGNELFEYVSTLALAWETHHTPVFLGSTILKNDLKKYQESSLALNTTQLEQRCSKAKAIGESACCKYNEAFTKLDLQQDYIIGLYLQSYRYFDKYRPQIVEAIRFNDDIHNKADRILRELRQKYNTTLIGVHVRHGDISLPEKQTIGYPLPSPDYFQRAFSYFCGLYPGCVLVVASDSLAWCRANLPTNHTLHFLTDNPPAVDMTVLTSLDHVITTFGTFSWWVGYLNPGRTVYMKDFIKNNTYIGNSFHPHGEDYIYPGWIPL